MVKCRAEKKGKSDRIRSHAKSALDTSFFPGFTFASYVVRRIGVKDEENPICSRLLLVRVVRSIVFYPITPSHHGSLAHQIPEPSLRQDTSVPSSCTSLYLLFCLRS